MGFIWGFSFILGLQEGREPEPAVLFVTVAVSQGG
jgi:hypothetical protein